MFLERMSWLRNSDGIGRNRKEHVKKIGDFNRLDEAIDGSLWGMLHNPKAYDVVEGMADVRLLKTEKFGSGTDSFPALGIWFRVDEIKERVELLMIESVQEEEDDDAD